MQKLKCKELASTIEQQIKQEADSFKITFNKTPSLSVILVGNNPASITYVSKKEEICERVGLNHKQYNLPDTTSEQELLNLIDSLNKDNDTDGILVQLPLPSHINTEKVLDRIAVNKDVDGFSATMSGLLFQNRSKIIACTPAGIMKILEYWNIPIEGKRAVVIGRSNIVGRPISTLLLNANATVITCHSKTPPEDLKKICLEADIIVVAVGKPGLIDSSYIKDRAVVVDVGINRIPDNTKEKGFRLTGDFNPLNLENRDVKYTPVPGGVGVMTTTMLAYNTLQCAKLNIEES